MIWKILKILLFVVLGLLIIAAGAALWAYNNLTLKTANLCITNESIKTDFSCSTVDDCVAELRKQEVEEGREPTPQFVVDFLRDYIHCRDNLCEIQRIRGFDEEITTCKENEQQITLKITPKDVVKPDRISELIKAWRTGKLGEFQI